MEKYTKNSVSFRLSITQDGAPLIDTMIAARGPEEEGKAKEAIRRILYGTPILWSESRAEPVSEPQEAVPSEPKEKPVLEPKNPKPTTPIGLKGALHLVCPKCGREFGAFLRDYQESIVCKCGHEIDLTDPTTARYEYDCVNCKEHRYGMTNFEVSEFEIQCRCGTTNKLKWNKVRKRYTNQQGDIP